MVSIPMLSWPNGPKRLSFPPAAGEGVTGSTPAPVLAPSGHLLQLSNLACGHPLPIVSRLTLPEW